MSISAAMRRASASRIVRNTKPKERDRWIALWNYFLTAEIEAGSLFLCTIPDRRAYVVLGDSHEVIPLPARGGERWHAYFHTTYGFAEREKITKFIYDSLRSYALTRGERVELRRFARYDLETQTAYISAYDGHFYKIEGAEQITVETQGTDNVFFADDDGGLNVEPDVGNHGLLLPRLTQPNFTTVKGSPITPEQQRMALTIWLFAVAFPDLLPTKPILLLEGEKGSGKTSAIQFLHLILFGADRPINLRKDKEDDFSIILLRNPITLIDNQDNFVEWLPDALCAYATGAVWERRKLFTDDENVIIKPRSFVAFTTRNPASFRRDDVVDRCIILRFSRRTTFTDEAVLRAEILADRARLFGEYLWYVGRIVDELRAPQEAAAAPAAEVYRMASFVAFGRVVGRVLGWTTEAVDGLMQAIQATRDAFLIEEDPLIDLINAWLTYTYGPQVKRPPNRGRLISVFELASELEWLAEVQGLPWKESPRTLGMKLKASHIEGAFRIEKLMHNGHQAFRIWRKTDPVFEVIDGDGVGRPQG